MKKIAIVILALAAVGCSSKPEISDLQPSLVEGWNDCPYVKPVNFKKLNGVDNKNVYVMKISYELEFQVNMEGNVQGFSRQKVCTQVLEDLLIARKIPLLTIKKGYLVPIEGDFDMVKSEKGWIPK